MKRDVEKFPFLFLEARDVLVLAKCKYVWTSMGGGKQGDFDVLR
jgi:hypothetical protein